MKHTCTAHTLCAHTSHTFNPSLSIVCLRWPTVEQSTAVSVQKPADRHLTADTYAPFILFTAPNVSPPGEFLPNPLMDIDDRALMGLFRAIRLSER